MSRSRYLLLAFVLLAIVALLMASCLALLPTLVRALPGRYAYYLPEPLQEWRHVEHPDTLPTPQLAPTATPLPSLPTPPPPTPSPLPSPKPTPSPTPELPAAMLLGGMRHEHQGWNNCGPTTLAMALSFWGRPETQYDVASTLKPDPEDKNVSPEEMAGYVRGLRLGAIVRVGGDLMLLKRLIVAGFPVVVETWYVRAPNDQMGHYRLIIGYDDAAQEFITHDSLHGPELPIGYQELDELWRAFDRVYLVVYPPDREAEVAAVLGERFDEQTSIAQALERAQQEALASPSPCIAYADCGDGEVFAWFNIGSNLVAQGEYAAAAAAYDQARLLGLPWRMLWYQFDPYEAYFQVGRYEDVIALADATLRVTGNLEESLYWRGRARLALGDREGARNDFRAALHYHDGWPPAVAALAESEP